MRRNSREFWGWGSLIQNDVGQRSSGYRHSMPQGSRMSTGSTGVVGLVAGQMWDISAILGAAAGLS